MAKSKQVVLFALIKNQKILLEKRPVGKSKRTHLIPGGAVNDHLSEDPKTALKREMMEELGVVPTDFNRLTNHGISGIYNNTLTPYIVTSWQGDIPSFILDKDDPYPLEWIEIDRALDLLPVKASKKILRLLKKYLSHL